MRPDENDLDEELRGHLALDIKERIDRGEDPVAARRAALKDLGYIPAVSEDMRRVWYSALSDEAQALARDVRFAWRSLSRAKGLTAAVVVTLALGIGANAAIFSVVRSVLLRPLVNREADRLIYIRQTAPGIGTDNLTFSMPEINDLKSRATSTIGSFGDFSTVEFTLVAPSKEPRVVTAGVVNGSFFEVMGLRPVLGRLLNPSDDGAGAAGVAVLTNRFWTTEFGSDPGVIGKTIRLGPGAVTIVGVLEPSVPYPTETQILANLVTSPHHLGATMVTDRRHRMTELFGRLVPGVSVEAARAELASAHAAMMREHPDAYSKQAQMQLQVKTLPEQLASPARTILLLLLGASAAVFIIACSNVANLILARSVRREGELAVRAALGAGRRALRRTLLAESLVLSAAGATLGLILAYPLVSIASQYAARFSVRALEATVDTSVLSLGVGLALAAAVLLAFVPRLPSPDRSGSGLGLAAGGPRITSGTNRRLRVFSMTQIACSFVLLAGAFMLISTLTALQTANTGFDMRQVLAIDVPPSATGVGEGTTEFFNEATRRLGELPGVQGVASSMIVPWRDVMGMKMQISFEGYQPANGEEDPTCRLRPISPRFFEVLGVPFVAGRDFNDADGRGAELVAIVSQSVAQRLFPNGEALNGRLWFTAAGKAQARRIVGVVADVDDQNVVQEPALTVYFPMKQLGLPSRLFVRASGDPYALVASVTRTLREVRADQAVERVATLEDVRAEVLTPERLNTFVFSTLGGMALLIAVVGIAGVLAFSVSARTREFGVRLAIGSKPSQLLAKVLKEGTTIVATGITAGAVFGGVLAAVAATSFAVAGPMPGVVPILGAAATLIVAAVIASLVPAARAASVDVVQALRSE